MKKHIFNDNKLVIASHNKGKVEEIKVSAEETDRLNKKIFEMMAENCGHHKDYFLDLVQNKLNITFANPAPCNPIILSA